MNKRPYGHRPPDIGAADFASGWIRGVRHLHSSSARESFWHRHDETSVIIGLRGEYIYELHGLPPMTLSRGSLIVIPAHVEHRHLKAVDPAGDRLEILLEPSPRKALAHSAFSAETCRRLHAELLKQALTQTKCSGEIVDLAQELHALAGRTAGRLSEEELGFARVLCQHILYRIALPKAPPQKRSAIPFGEVKKWLESHLAEKIDVSRLSSYIGYSRTQTFTIFRENTGLTPSDFLTRLRIGRARELLEETDRPAAHIAELCGFSSPSAFNATFRRHTGMPPLAWRRHARRQPG